MQLSNTWSIPLTEAIARLETFAKKNVDQDLQREFLVRGISKGYTAVVTVVPETRIKAYENKLDSFTKSIFSVSKKRSSFATQTFKLEAPQVINLPLDCGSRPVIVHVIPDARPAMEKDKKKNIFAVPGNSKKAEDVKKAAPESKSTPQEKTPQKQASSPEKGKASSATKKSAEKTVKGKPVAKPQLGKGSIASFFGQKAAVSPPTEKKAEAERDSPKTDPVKMEVAVEEAKVQEKPKPTKKVPKVEPESPKAPPPPKAKETPATDESSRKRNLSSDRGSDDKKKKNKSSPEEPSSKKAKKEVKTKKVEKRSRIMAICDSDSSGDEGTSAKQPQAVSDEEEAPAVAVKAKKAAKEAEKKASPDENRNPVNKKRKATRKVTKSYQDEDGFIRESSKSL